MDETWPTARPAAVIVWIAEAVAIWRELGERRHLAYSISELAACAAWRGRAALGRTQLADTLTFIDLQDRGGKVVVLWNCARLLTPDGKFLNSAVLPGAIYGYERALGKWIWCCAVLGQHHLESLRRRADADLVATALLTERHFRPPTRSSTLASC
jgi:hypothetical protein